MQNKNPNAILRLGDLDPALFVQDAEGKIVINTLQIYSGDRSFIYAPSADSNTGDYAYHDLSLNKDLWKLPLTNLFSSGGSYLGSAINFGFNDLV